MRLVLWSVLLAAAGAGAGCAVSIAGGGSGEAGTGHDTSEGFDAGSGTGGAGGGGVTPPADGGPRLAALPVAPDASHFMWQGMQTAFVDGVGNPCTAHVALGVGDQAVCYASPSGTLRCAGSIYTTVLGASFTDVSGVAQVDQILVSPTANTADHNAVCVKTRDGEAYCLGNYDDWGQFGTGATGPSATFVRFGAFSDVVALATGTWDQLCAVGATSGVLCAGNLFGVTPVSVAASASSFFVDSAGAAHVDDPGVFRVANGRSESQVTVAGAYYEFPPMPLTLASPGDVVDVVGNALYTPPAIPQPSQLYCWLDAAGAAWCGTSDGMMSPMPPPPVVTQVFTARKVLVLAGSFYSTSLCAVYDDGSIACRGDNTMGQLGVATPTYLATETVVQPPGTIDLSCD